MKNKLFGGIIALIFLIGLLPVNALDLDDFNNGEVYFVYGANSKSSDNAAGTTLAGSLLPQAGSIVISGESIDTYLDTPITQEFDSGDLSFLEEYTTSVNSENYDVEEKIILEGIEVVSDFEDEPRLIIPRSSIKYLLEIENDLVLDDVTEENPLIVMILGSEYKIIDIDSNSFTYLTAKRYDVRGYEISHDGEEVTEIDGEEIEILNIGSNKVQVRVEDESRTIYEGQVKQVGELKIKVEYGSVISRTSISESTLTLLIGEEVEKEVDNMDKMNEDYRWIVNFDGENNVLGIKFYDALTSDDEALYEGDSITLPENFAILEFQSTNNVEYFDIEFRLEEFEEIVYLVAEGFEEYDGIYMNGTGVFDEDFEPITEEIEIAELTLEYITDGIRIGDVEIIEELTSVLVNGESINDEELSVLSSYGIILVNPEEGLEDENPMERELTIRVPSKQLEITLNLNNKPSTTTIVGGEKLSIKGILDVDTSNSFSTIISVGGPAVNTLTKKYIGEWVYKNYESVIELFIDDETNQRILVVAGHSGADTTLAANLLSDYFKGKNDYFSDGTSFKITATNLNDIVVEKAGNGNTEEE